MNHLFGVLLGGVTTAAFAQRLTDTPSRGRVIIDVRTPEEYRQSHVPGAQLLPLEQLAARIAALVPDKSTPIALYGHADQQTTQARQQLNELGYRQVDEARTLDEALLRYADALY